MCSIIGGEITPDFKKNIEEYMHTLSHRGEKQGCGYILKTEEGLFVYSSMSLAVVVKNIQKVENGSFIIIHQRKASVGAVGIENTHPVKSNQGNVRVIHNGTRKVYKEFFGATSDSQGLASFLEVVPLEEHSKILKELGVLFYTLKKSGLFMYKDNLRPLVRHKDSELFASEPLFSGKWAAIKDQKVPIEIKSTISMPTDVYREVKYPMKVTSYYCNSCRKVHLRTTTLECGVCASMGKKPTITNTTTMSGTNRNSNVFELLPSGNYKVNAGCVLNNVYSKLKANKVYEASVTYKIKVTAVTYSLYVSVIRDGRLTSVAVDIQKFAKLNNLGSYDLVVSKQHKCLKCSGTKVVHGSYRVCTKCKSYTMCHI